MKKVNERYGNWTVLYLADHAPYGSRMCICRCDCGRLYKRSYSSIKNGESNQCKECRNVAFSNKMHRHGLSDSRVYRIWAKIKQRCTNPKTNTSGCKGVSYDKRRNKYRAYIGVRKKRYELGEYATIEQAVKARKDFIKNNNLTEYNE